MRRDEEMAPFVAELKRNYIFGGICSVAAQASIKVVHSIISIYNMSISTLELILPSHFQYLQWTIFRMIWFACFFVLIACWHWCKHFTQALGEIKSINLLGVQQICRNSIALEQVRLHLNFFLLVLASSCAPTCKTSGRITIHISEAWKQFNLCWG